MGVRIEDFQEADILTFVLAQFTRIKSQCCATRWVIIVEGTSISGEADVLSTHSPNAAVTSMFLKYQRIFVRPRLQFLKYVLIRTQSKQFQHYESRFGLNVSIMPEWSQVCVSIHGQVADGSNRNRFGESTHKAYPLCIRITQMPCLLCGYINISSVHNLVKGELLFQAHGWSLVDHVANPSK